MLQGNRNMFLPMGCLEHLQSDQNPVSLETDDPYLKWPRLSQSEISYSNSCFK